jgi:periplasmic protein TonB
MQISATEAEAMFEDSLMESGGRLARRNPWTTAFSFALQIFAGGILVLTSMIYTETLPAQKLLSVLEAPVPPPAAAPEPRAVAQAATSTSEFAGGVLVPPREIPTHAKMIQDQAPPGNPLVNSEVGVLNSTGDGASNSVLTDVLRSTPVAVPKVSVNVSVNKVRVSSGVAQGLLVRQIKPEYPALARQARIEGTVMLQATIGKDGTVQNLRVISGHPMLTASAIAAARQWLYKPYYLNGEPVGVETQINVIFTLTGD